MRRNRSSDWLIDKTAYGRRVRERAAFLHARRARRSPRVLQLIAAGEKRDLISVESLLRADYNLCISTCDCRDFATPDSAAELSYVALVLAFFDQVPSRLLKSDGWHLLEHQCGGLTCNQQLMVAVPLKLRQDVRPRLIAFACHYFQSNIGWWRLGGQALADFRTLLARLGLPSSWPAERIFEALYPADASQAVLDTVALDPPNLLALTGGRPETAAICVLAPNSD